MYLFQTFWRTVAVSIVKGLSGVIARMMYITAKRDFFPIKDVVEMFLRAPAS
jgi:hypothetical protein